jgi:hypothetical protein
MTTADCAAHEWRVSAVEVAGTEVWTEEVCRHCGDERVNRRRTPLTTAALAVEGPAGAGR